METFKYEDLSNTESRIQVYARVNNKSKRAFPNMGMTKIQGAFKRNQFPKSISPFKRIRNR